MSAKIPKIKKMLIITQRAPIQVVKSDFVIKAYAVKTATMHAVIPAAIKTTVFPFCSATELQQ